MYLKYLLVFILIPFTIYAQDSFDDDLDGFDSEMVLDDDNVEVIKEESNNLSINGDLSFKTSFGYIKHQVNNINYDGVNQAKTALYLQLDYKFSDNWKLRTSGDVFYDSIYDIKSKDYNQNILDDYRTQVMLDDTYIQGKLSDSLDVKLGRQIVVWGKSDSIRITDIINPLDNRLLGITDIKNLRMSVAMLKSDYYIDQWNISTMIIGENRIMKEATPNSEFLPNNLPKLTNPDNSLKDLQFAIAINGIFSGWDLSFYGANILDQKWHINQKTKTREVSKIKMLGSAINIAYGSWLIKSEIAFLNGIKYNSTLNEKNRLDSLIGFDYMGIKDTTLSFEMANRHIYSYESKMQENSDYVKQNELQTAIRMTHSFLNDSLNLSTLLNIFGSSWENGGFARVWFSYDIADGINSNFGIVDYIGGDKPFFKAIEDNDRVFADITYSF